MLFPTPAGNIFEGAFITYNNKQGCTSGKVMRIQQSTVDTARAFVSVLTSDGNIEVISDVNMITDIGINIAQLDDTLPNND